MPLVYNLGSELNSDHSILLGLAKR